MQTQNAIPTNKSDKWRSTQLRIHKSEPSQLPDYHNRDRIKRQTSRPQIGSPESDTGMLISIIVSLWCDDDPALGKAEGKWPQNKRLNYKLASDISGCLWRVMLAKISWYDFFDSEVDFGGG